MIQWDEAKCSQSLGHRHSLLVCHRSAEVVVVVVQAYTRHMKQKDIIASVVLLVYADVVLKIIC